MEKVIVFSATNRPGSYTSRVAAAYSRILNELNVENEVFDFGKLPHDLAFTETFGNRTEAFSAIIRQYVTGNNKFIFIVPEYNGSFPGILKTFLDAVPPREWNDKEACLVGVSDGRAGNLRGMEHLTGVLQYLKMHVYHNKLPISVIARVMNEKGELNEEQLRVSIAQVKGFLRIS